MIRAAVIGMGGISRTHIEAYRKFPDRCAVAALSDCFIEKARQKKDEFELEAAIYDNYRLILDDPRIDLVSICTPPYTHASIAIDCLNAGKHVICEKPMASSLAECDAMIAASEASGKILAIIAQNRFRAPIQRLKKVLESGLAGRILHAQVDSFWRRGHCYYDLWWRGTWAKEGGGCTMNHAVHHIDMFQWMMGLPLAVRAVMANADHDNAEVEDLSIAILQYPRALAQITSSVVHHGEEQQIVFQAENARVSFPWKVSASRFRSNGFPDPHPELEKELNEYYNQIPEPPHELHEGEIDNVLTAVETGAPILVDGREGRKTLELITAIYQSASTDAAVKLPLGESSPFYTAEGVQKNAIHFFEKRQSLDNFADDKIIVGSSSDQKR